VTVEYFHLAPVILTDDLFFEFQPSCVVTGSVSNRRAAYLTAEQQMMRELSTFLLPTSVTGTFTFPFQQPLELPHDRVKSIDSVVALSADEGCSCDLTEYKACAFLRDSLGYIDVRVVEGAWAQGCGCGGGHFYQLRVAYTAGLPTGVAADDSSLHAALSMAAATALREIVDPGSNEGGPGAPGITQWSADRYSETRVTPKKTAFGQTAQGTYIANMVRHLKRFRALRLPRR
jgi:hypothetical protein